MLKLHWRFMNYYRLLGVSRNATAKDIRRAYHRMMQKHHPDVNKDKDAVARSSRINEAYEILSDPQTRSNYDRELTAKEMAITQNIRPQPNSVSHNPVPAQSAYTPGSINSVGDFAKEMVLYILRVIADGSLATELERQRVAKDVEYRKKRKPLS